MRFHDENKKNKEFRKVILLLTFLFTASTLMACNEGEENGINKNTNVNCDIISKLPEKELGLYSEFIQYGIPVYLSGDTPYVDFSLELTEIGKKYMKTGLFNDTYHVSFIAKDVKTRNEFFSLNDITWNITDAKKEFHLKLELEDSTIKELERKIKEKDYHQVTYTIELYPDGNGSFVLSNKGFFINE